MKESWYNNAGHRANLMPNAEPVFKIGNDTGFLFLHGFTASPYEGRELAEKLHSDMGLTISLPLLPGHGTEPANLKDVSWQDWYLYAREKFLELRKNCRALFVCGQSMGAALALHLASHHRVEGVISLAGAVFLKDWRLKLLPLARHLVPYQHKSRGPDIRDKKQKQIIPTYSKYPVRSVDQLLALLEHARQDLPEITAPALLFHSRKDRTVRFENLDYIYEHISSAKKERIVLEKSYHLISLDVEKTEVYNRIRAFIEENLDSNPQNPDARR